MRSIGILLLSAILGVSFQTQTNQGGTKVIGLPGGGPGSGDASAAEAAAAAANVKATTANTNATVAQQRAAAQSFAEKNFVCDASASYLTAAGTLSTYGPSSSGAGNSVFFDQASLLSGTDNKTAWANALNAAYNPNKHNPIGLSIEGGPSTAPQFYVVLPPGCNATISDSPILPHGGYIDGRNSTLFATGKPLIQDIGIDANNLSGHDNTTIENLTIVCTGTIGYNTPTWPGAIFHGGLGLTLNNVRFYNCPIGYIASQYEYLTINGQKVGHNRIGFIWDNVGFPVVDGKLVYPISPSSAAGAPAIDNDCFGCQARTNWINGWFKGAGSIRMWGGTGSYGKIINYILGEPLPHWIATVTPGAPTNGQPISCTANSTVKLQTTDPSGTTGAEITYWVNSTGDGGDAVVGLGVGNGDYTNPSITAPAPNGSVPGCSNPPTFTATIHSMDGWDYPVSNTQSYEAVDISFIGQNIEAFTKTETGLVFYGGPSASRSRIIFNDLLQGGGRDFTHLAYFRGNDNLVSGNNGMGNSADPWDGKRCQLLASQSNSFIRNPLNSVDTPNNICLLNGTKTILDASNYGGVKAGNTNIVARPTITDLDDGSGSGFEIRFMAHNQPGVQPTDDTPFSPAGTGISGPSSCHGMLSYTGGWGPYHPADPANGHPVPYYDFYQGPNNSQTMIYDGSLTCDNHDGTEAKYHSLAQAGREYWVGSNPWDCQMGASGGGAPLETGSSDQMACKNTTGKTVTLKAVTCTSDVSTTATIDVVKNGSGTSLLSTPVGCSPSGTTATLIATPTVLAGETLDLHIASVDGTVGQVLVTATGVRP